MQRIVLGVWLDLMDLDLLLEANSGFTQSSDDDDRSGDILLDLFEVCLATDQNRNTSRTFMRKHSTCFRETELPYLK